MSSVVQQALGCSNPELYRFKKPNSLTAYMEARDSRVQDALQERASREEPMDALEELDEEVV